MNPTPAYDFAPALPMLVLGGLLALVPAVWTWRRRQGRGAVAWRRALTVLTLFLTFDLVLFGAYTRLSDSGLGCPDWPGCYGSTTPLGARAAIDAAQTALPGGPVTHGKAWIEMVHRYLATGVGGLILLSTLLAWRARWRARTQARAGAGADTSASGGASASAGVRTRRHDAIGLSSPWWPTVTLAWVALQGAFGAWTVTWKLYPAIVTAHLLGGIGLLTLLALQTRAAGRPPLSMPAGLRRLAWAVAATSVVQVALGGWVSTNDAVLACLGFPTCQGSWWPAMDFTDGFTVRRGLGLTGDGAFLPFAALTAIHYTHRLVAGLVLSGMALLAWRLIAAGGELRRWGRAVAAVGVWQAATGVGNVLLGWPLAAALGHTGGAAVLIALLAVLVARAGVSPAVRRATRRPTSRLAGQAR